MKIQLKRAYDEPARTDGCRVLVDRLWPRGISKQQLQLDSWMKEIVPSTTLRKWFNHESEKWREFKRRYFKELQKNPEAVARLLAQCHSDRLTLVFGAKDRQHNHAAALMEFLASDSGRSPRPRKPRKRRAGTDRHGLLL